MTAAALETDWPAPAPTPVLGPYVTYAQIEALTGYARSTVLRAVAAGYLKRYGGPRSARFLATDVAAWIESGVGVAGRGSQSADRPAGLPVVDVGF